MTKNLQTIQQIEESCHSKYINKQIITSKYA